MCACCTICSRVIRHKSYAAVVYCFQRSPARVETLSRWASRRPVTSGSRTTTAPGACNRERPLPGSAAIRCGVSCSRASSRAPRHAVSGDAVEIPKLEIPASLRASASIRDTGAAGGTAQRRRRQDRARAGRPARSRAAASSPGPSVGPGRAASRRASLRRPELSGAARRRSRAGRARPGRRPTE